MSTTSFAYYLRAPGWRRSLGAGENGQELKNSLTLYPTFFLARFARRRGVGKTTLVIRAVRYSAERMAHVRRVNYVSFPELKDYFEIQERKNRDRDEDFKGGFYSLKR